MSALIIIGILTLLYLLYRHITRNFNYWKIRNIPHIKPTVFWGNAYTMLMQKETVGQFCQRLYNSTDSTYLGYFAFDQPFLLIRSPEIVKAVLVKDFEHFSDRSVTTSTRSDFVGKNFLFIINNPEWRTLRTSMSPVFSSGKIKQMYALMEKVGEKLVQYIHDKKSPELSAFIGCYATDVIASCAFGIDAGSLENEENEFRLMVQKISSPGFSRSIQRACCFFAPFLVNLFGFTFVERTAGDYVSKIFLRILADREKENIPRGDLIDLLIKIKKKQENSSERVTDEQLIAQAAQYLFAGIETIEITILLAIYELSINQDVQIRLRQEINENLKDEECSYESIQKLKYLDMVVKETLRKHPVLPYLDRRCTKDYQLPGTDVTIDKGVPIFISLYGLQMDPEYFPEPEKFIPERFLEENLNSMFSYLYMPFGIGPRNCPGEKFGSLSSKMAILKIIQNFEVLPTEKTPIPLKVLTRGIVILHDGDFHLQFKPVQSS